MGSFYLAPVTAIFFGICIVGWAVFLAWAGMHWLVRRWHWPWPLAVLIQSVLAAQVYWLIAPMMMLDSWCCRNIAMWLEPVARWWLGLNFLPLLLGLRLVPEKYGIPPHAGGAAPVFAVIYSIQYIVSALRKRRARLSGK